MIAALKVRSSRIAAFDLRSSRFGGCASGFSRIGSDESLFTTAPSFNPGFFAASDFDALLTGTGGFRASVFRTAARESFLSGTAGFATGFVRRMAAAKCLTLLADLAALPRADDPFAGAAARARDLAGAAFPRAGFVILWDFAGAFALATERRLAGDLAFERACSFARPLLALPDTAFGRVAFDALALVLLAGFVGAFALLRAPTFVLAPPAADFTFRTGSMAFFEALLPGVAAFETRLRIVFPSETGDAMRRAYSGIVTGPQHSAAR